MFQKNNMNPFSKNLFFTELSDNSGLEWFSRVSDQTLQKTKQLPPVPTPPVPTGLPPVNIEKNYYENLGKTEVEEEEKKGGEKWWPAQSKNDQKRIEETLNILQSQLKDPGVSNAQILTPRWVKEDEVGEYAKFAKEKNLTMGY